MNVRRVTFAFLVLSLAGARRPTKTHTTASTIKPQRPIVGRSVVATTHGIVAASQPLAARAGVQILERGGNAIDAAIAANATIGLMEPTGNGIGGDLFIIYYEAKTGTVHGLNASGWAPTGLTVDFLAVEGHQGDAAARHLFGDRAWRGRGMARDARASSAPSRSPSCWRRRSATPRTASRCPRASRVAGPAR